MKSTLGKLGANDFLKGLALAGIIPVLLVVQQSIAAGSLVFNWQAISMAAVAGFVGYLLKNLATDSTKEAVKTLDAQGVKMIDTTTQATVTPNNLKEVQKIASDKS